MSEARAEFPAYAYEVRVGDVVDGRTVEAIASHVDPDKITLARKGAADTTYAREDEVTVRRLISQLGKS